MSAERPEHSASRAKKFRAKYGPWAVVAGASEGLGEAFADALAARGLNLVLVARRSEVLAKLAERLRERSGIEVRTEAFDLARPDLAEFVERATFGLEVGLAVYNAAFSPVGLVLEEPLEDLVRVVDVNVRGPVVFARTLAPAMASRGRGGIVIMSSLAGFQGTPRLATYAASKAFGVVFGESLWSELRPRGVDVVVSCAGAIRTPAFRVTIRDEVPGTLDASVVAEQTLDALGKGPSVVPGATNQLARFVMGHLLPRRAAIAIMARSSDTFLSP